MSDASGEPQDISNPRALYVAASLALFVAGMSFALRLSVIGALQQEHLVGIDATNAGEMAGALLGITFFSFGVTLLLASSLLSWLGMGRILLLCGSSFVLGTLGIGFADEWASGQTLYSIYWIGFLACGLGWGFMEATVNPLTAAAYPDDKTNRLNRVHAWWPAGIIAGGLGALGLEAAGARWETQFALTLLPALGVCFLWPTMLANLAERFPRGDEFLIGLMGVAGALSIAYLLPALGRAFDSAKLEAAGGQTAFVQLEGSALEEVLVHAATTSFEVLALAPAFLFFVFGAIWVSDRRKARSSALS